MKIGLLSDTHSFLDERLLEHFKNCDEIWHGGDIGAETVADTLEAFKPFRAVYGNIDSHKIRIRYPLDNIFTVEDVKIYITHIGGYPGRYNKRALEVIRQERPKLFICGHSHILKVMHDKEQQLLAMNPGAAGREGFHKVRTGLRFEINSGKIEKLEVIELGLRGSL